MNATGVTIREAILVLLKARDAGRLVIDADSDAEFAEVHKAIMILSRAVVGELMKPSRTASSIEFPDLVAWIAHIAGAAERGGRQRCLRCGDDLLDDLPSVVLGAQDPARLFWTPGTTVWLSGGGVSTVIEPDGAKADCVSDQELFERA